MCRIRLTTAYAKAIYHSIPKIDGWLLLVPSLLICFTFIALSLTTGESGINQHLLNCLLNSPIGGNKLTLGTSICIAVAVFHMSFAVGKALQKDGVMLSPKERLRLIAYTLIPYLKSAFFVLALIGSAAMALLLCCKYLYLHISPDYVYRVSIFLSELELQLLGTFPALTLQQHYPNSFVERWIVESYNLLFFVSSFVLCVVFLFDRNLFRGFCISFFYIAALSVTISAFIPVLQPDSMFLLNLLKRPVPEGLQSYANSFTASNYLQEAMAAWRHIWIPTDRFELSITTFPSLHTAWGIVAVYWLSRLNLGAGLLFVPWMLGNMIGTVYSGQHLVIDSVASVILVSIIILLVEKFCIHRPDEQLARTYFLIDSINKSTQKWIKKYANRLPGILSTKLTGKSR